MTDATSPLIMRWVPRRVHSLVSSAKPPFHQVIQLDEVDVKWKSKRGCRSNHRWMAGVLCGRRIVAHDMAIDKAEASEQTAQARQVLGVRAAQAPEPAIGYLPVGAVALLLEHAGTSWTSRPGAADNALRHRSQGQEACDLSIGDLHLGKPASVTLTGKGRKTRTVPRLGWLSLQLECPFPSFPGSRRDLLTWLRQVIRTTHYAKKPGSAKPRTSPNTLNFT